MQGLPPGYGWDLTPEELRMPPARWRERRESWLHGRRRERGYDLSGFTKRTGW